MARLDNTTEFTDEATENPGEGGRVYFCGWIGLGCWTPARDKGRFFAGPESFQPESFSRGFGQFREVVLIEWVESSLGVVGRRVLHKN